MAEIIPALSREVLTRMTPGEKRFSQRLKDLLEDDYLCWYDIPIGKNQRYPDFILLHPARGLLFLEVKDWKPSSIKQISKETVTLRTEQGKKIRPNPFVQVRQCAYRGLDLLQKDPALRQEVGPHKGNLVTPYAWGVVFTNISRRQIERAIPEEQRANLLPDHLVIYKEEMLETEDPEVFQKRLWDMFPYQFPEKLSLPQIDRIRWHLFPEIRINDVRQVSLFDDEDANTDIDTDTDTDLNSVPDIVKIMDLQQEKLARSLGKGHRVIHGVAGSGKTLILGYRAELLAQTTSKPILILCFNVVLAAKLRSFIQSKGISEQVQIHHFHEWCNSQLKTYHVDVIIGKEKIWERQVLSVIHGVDNGQIPRAQYGAVLIDEGHDFEAEWLKLVVQMIDTEEQSLLLLYDDAQSIYKKKTGLGFSLSSVGVRAQGRTTILKLNYRNTREILSFAYDFAAEYFKGVSTTEEDVPLIQPEAAGKNGPQPKVHVLNSWQNEVDNVLKCVQAWKEQGLAWRDMSIVYVAQYHGRDIANKLKQAGIPHLWMCTKEYKQAYNTNEDRVSILTLQSSKGLEFPAVILPGIDKLANTDAAQNARLLYVGMTRAQEHLALSMSSDTTLTRRIRRIAT